MKYVVEQDQAYRCFVDVASGGIHRSIGERESGVKVTPENRAP